MISCNWGDNSLANFAQHSTRYACDFSGPDGIHSPHVDQSHSFNTYICCWTTGTFHDIFSIVFKDFKCFKMIRMKSWLKTWTKNDILWKEMYDLIALSVSVSQARSVLLHQSVPSPFTYSRCIPINSYSVCQVSSLHKLHKPRSNLILLWSTANWSFSENFFFFFYQKC